MALLFRCHISWLCCGVCSVLARTASFLHEPALQAECLPGELLSQFVDAFLDEAVTESRFGVVRADALQALGALASWPAYPAVFKSKIEGMLLPLCKCADGRIAERALCLCKPRE
jgi:hypothetical protein